MSFLRKSIRLPPTEYFGTRIYFLTICCHQRHSAFADKPIGLWITKSLMDSAARFHFLLHAYCVMPNHVHVLTEAVQPSCHLSEFVSDFKQRTGFYCQRKIGCRLWQPRYYDHLLRKAEDTDPAARYIWWNPVRGGLCANPRDYTLSGSQTVDWQEHCPSSADWTPPWKAQQKLPG
jgi:putative transposase